MSYGSSEFQYLDLIKLSQMVKQGSISKLNLVVLLGKTVAPPVDFECVQFPQGVAFVEGTLMCGAFNRGDLEKYATSIEFRNLIRSGMKDVHLLEGKISVLVPESYINSGLVSIYGRLSVCHDNRCRFYMAQWGFDKVSGKYVPKAVNITSPAFGVYTESYFKWIQGCISSKNYNKPIPCPSSLQITGIDREKIIPPRLGKVNDESKVTVSQSDNSLGELFNITGSDLGVGSQFNQEGVSQNDISSPIPTAHKPIIMTSDIDLLRKEIIPTTASFKTVKSELSKCTNKLEASVHKMETNKSIIEACIKMFVMTLPRYWTRRPNGVGSTGRDIFFTACRLVYDSMYSNEDDEDGGKDKGINLDTISELYNTNPEIVEIWGSSEGKVLRGLNFFRQYREAILYALFEVILETNCSVLKLSKLCTDRDIDFLSLINENPYKLCFISSAVSLDDMDKFAMVTELFNKDGEILKHRTIAYIHFYMCDSNNMIINDSTIIPRQTLEKRIKVGYVLNNTERRRMVSSGGVYLKDKTYANIESYFVGMKKEHCMLPTNGRWQKVDNFHEVLLLGVTNKQAIDWYVESGMGLQTSLSGVISISDYSMASKEAFIYEKIQRIFRYNKPDNDIKDIDEIVNNFEDMKSKELGIDNFKLENRQREAVKMIGSPVYAVIGGAGCGKTTTAEAIVYALQSVFDYTDEEIVYAAPTGRAASRLKESVKRPTRTIHSLFGIGGTSTFILNESSENKLSDARVLILDECSMINLNVMYEIMRGISNDIKIVMLGDIAQLPPIGFGKPFANLLGFIPCVKLNVSKRASAKSLITRNANALLDASVSEELQSGKDFKNISIDSSEAVTCISNLVEYHLGLKESIPYPTTDLGVLNKNDIQIVTPVKTKSYEWGSDNLNTVLQDIFNPYKSQRALYCMDVTGTKINAEYRVGDRVVHTKNISDINRYSLFGKQFESVGEGIVNGEIGVIKRIITASEMHDLTEDDFLLNFAKFDSTLFIEVEYDNVTIDEDDIDKYSIMYPIRCSTDAGGNYGVLDGRFVTTNTISLITLAYALTVHKMQGSQAKLVIVPIFKTRRSGFISRNMVYTAVTRASKGCYLVGDVSQGGKSTALSDARRVEITGSRSTLFEQYTE